MQEGRVKAMKLSWPTHTLKTSSPTDPGYACELRSSNVISCMLTTENSSMLLGLYPPYVVSHI